MRLTARPEVLFAPYKSRRHHSAGKKKYQKRNDRQKARDAIVRGRGWKRGTNASLVRKFLKRPVASPLAGTDDQKKMTAPEGKGGRESEKRVFSGRVSAEKWGLSFLGPLKRRSFYKKLSEGKGKESEERRGRLL